MGAENKMEIKELINSAVDKHEKFILDAERYIWQNPCDRTTYNDDGTDTVR